MGNGGRQRQEEGVRPQIRRADTAHEAWRHADCHRNIASKPHANGPHGHHGQMSGERNQPYTTKEGYSFDNSINSKVLCFAFGLVAEIERNLISMRTKEALALRKAEGVVLGRKKGSYTKMNVLIENRKVVVGMLKRDCTIADICRRFNISRDTFLKFRSRYKEIDKAMKEKEIRRKGMSQKRTV